MHRILVTGGAGFIGSNLASKLLEEGHQVVVLDDLSGGFMRNVPTEATLEVVDICNAELVDWIFEKYEFDIVYHLAAYAAEGLSYYIPRYNYNNNLIGSINIINACILHNVSRIIFTSSMAVYGEHDVPYVETMTPQPIDPYGIAKWSVEQHLRAMYEVHGLEYVIFRPQNVYGRNQHIGDSYRNVIGIFINQCLRGEPMTVFGDGTQMRAFSHVSTILPYFVDAMDRRDCVGHTFNIGGEHPYTINELADVISQELGGEVVHLPARHEVKYAYASPEKAKSFFCGVEYKDVDLRTGVKDMIVRAQALGPQNPTKFHGVEIQYNLPDKWAKLLS